jgi:hypothetical protein
VFVVNTFSYIGEWVYSIKIDNLRQKGGGSVVARKVKKPTKLRV